MRFLKSPVSTGLFLLAGSFFGAACTSGTSKVSTQPVVQVNAQPLTAKEFSSRLAQRLKDLDAITAKDPATIQSSKDEIIKAFVVQSLILDWARAKDLKVDDKDLDREVEKIRAGYPDDLAFRRSLAAENMSFSEWREDLRRTLIERAFFAKLNEKVKAPTDDDVKKYFEENRAAFKKKERVYLRQIVTDDENKAQMLKTETKSKDFATLAKKYSSAPEASSGGLVGWIEKGSVDFFDGAFTQSIGSVSQVVRSPFGYHLLKVEKKLPASNGSIDEARPEISKIIKGKREQAEFVAWLDGQIRSAKILKDDELIRSIRVETRSRDE